MEHSETGSTTASNNSCNCPETSSSLSVTSIVTPKKDCHSHVIKNAVIWCACMHKIATLETKGLCAHPS